MCTGQHLQPYNQTYYSLTILYYKVTTKPNHIVTESEVRTNITQISYQILTNSYNCSYTAPLPLLPLTSETTTVGTITTASGAITRQSHVFPLALHTTRKSQPRAYLLVRVIQLRGIAITGYTDTGEISASCTIHIPDTHCATLYKLTRWPFLPLT